MAALDAINHRFGRVTLRFAGELMGRGWQRRADHLSCVSTTRWAALPVVRAGRCRGMSNDFLIGLVIVQRVAPFQQSLI